MNPKAAGFDMLSVGDRCMQETNDPDLGVWNGECGTVIKAGRSGITVAFEDGAGRREVAYSKRQMNNLSMAYACTIHKSQGQEYPAIIVPVYMQHFHLLSRELIYTALTRASQLAIFVGERKALASSLKKQKALKLLVKKRAEGRLPDNVSVNIVLNGWNYKVLPKMLKYFYGLGLDDVRANFIRAEGYAEDDWSLTPRYEDVVPVLMKAVVLNEFHFKQHFTFGGFPLCVLPTEFLANRRMSRKYLGEST